MLDAEGFKEWLRRGPERAPSLYGGKILHKPYDPPKTASQGPNNAHQVPIGKQMFEERKEWDRKQAVSDHDDDDCMFREVFGEDGE